MCRGRKSRLPPLRIPGARPAPRAAPPGVARYRLVPPRPCSAPASLLRSPLGLCRPRPGRCVLGAHFLNDSAPQRVADPAPPVAINHSPLATCPPAPLLGTQATAVEETSCDSAPGAHAPCAARTPRPTPRARRTTPRTASRARTQRTTPAPHRAPPARRPAPRAPRPAHHASHPASDASRPASDARHLAPRAQRPRPAPRKPATLPRQNRKTAEKIPAGAGESSFFVPKSAFFENFFAL